MFGLSHLRLPAVKASMASKGFARFMPTVPEGVRPEVYFTCLTGAAVLCGALGLQAILIMMLFVPLPPWDTQAFTTFGASAYSPEYDIQIYLLGIFCTAVLVLVFGWLWNRRVGTVELITERYLLRSGMRQLLAGIIGTVVFVILYINARDFAGRQLPVPSWYPAAFGVIAVLSIAASVAGSRSKTDGQFSIWISGLLRQEIDESTRRKFSPLDLFIPLAILALVYVVDGKALAGKIFLVDSIMHWDYFAIGPSLSVRHGLALGEVHSSYGVGWPLVFGYLSSLVPIRVGHMLQIGSLYACVYFLVIYALLRLLVRPWAAALGVLLLLTQLVLAMGDISIWIIPSLSVLRWPFDVWCFLTLAVHFKSGKRFWALLAGGSVGLGIVFVLDTGLYLAAAFAFYWLCTLGIAQSRFRKGWFLPSVGVGALVVFMFLGIASRWTIFGVNFWKHWVETVLEFSGGFGMLPLATAPNEITLVVFVLFALFGLGLMSYAVMRALHGRSSHLGAFLGFLGFYGLLCLMHFIGRSYHYQPLRLWIPLGVAFIILADRAYSVLSGELSRRWGVRAGRAAVAVPVGAVVLLVAFLVAMPRALFIEPFLAYPNTLYELSHTGNPDSLCLLEEPQDICELPEELRPTVAQFHEIVDRLEKIEGEGKTFAAIEGGGSLFYLATDTAPWGRYSRLFVSLRTREQLRKAVADLKDHPVDYVLIRGPGEVDARYEQWPLYSFGFGLWPDSFFSDTREAFGEAVQNDYQLVERIGPYELRRHI